MASYFSLLSLSLCWFLNFNVEIKSLEKEIERVIDNYDAIGVSVVVVKKNKIVYNKSFGYNPDYNDQIINKPIPKNGKYWLASVSKTFISTAIMQLVESGYIQLDDDINKYLNFKVYNPLYPNTPITVRMLLCHRSSINDSQFGRTLKMMDIESNNNYAGNYNNYPPGEKYSYCNLNYSLLGVIIENATGMRFDEYIDKFIIEPLRLNGSFNLTKIDSSLLVRAYVYNQEEKKFEKDNNIYDYNFINQKIKNYKLGLSTAYLSPSGGMRLSAIDLSKWMRVMMNYGRYKGKRIISKESVKEMWTPQAPDQKYGFAFSHYDKVVEGESFIGMTGGSHGIHSAMFFNPDDKYGFVVICNGCNSTWQNGGDMNYEIVRVLYNNFIVK